MSRTPLGFFDARDPMAREEAIEITNRIRVQAGGEPITEAEIAASHARLDALITAEITSEND